MNRQHTEHKFVVNSLMVTFTLALTLMSSAVSVSNTCNGTVDFSILYNDGQIKSVRIDGVSAPIDTGTSTPTVPLGLPIFKQEAFAGENGINVDNGYHFRLIPDGRSGSCVVHLFDYETKVWSTIDVYCHPLGLTYRRDRDEVVGFCAVNATYGPSVTCVPYFKLHIQDGQWVDVSRPGSCSQPLSTTNITNPVILQSDSDYEYDETRLYFAEHGTNRLHEVSLSAGEATYYETDATLKIDHLVPVKTSNASFFGLRVVCYHLENSFSFYHKLFLWQLDSTQQQQTGFIEESVQTESVAFDSYNLDYLVTFNANRNTVIINKDGQSQYYQNLPTLDYPIQCQNLAESSTHYLICLAGNGYLPLLINLTGDAITNKSLASDETKEIIRVEVLAKDTFYLLNNQQELSIYLLTATVMYLETYTVHPNFDFVIATASSDITCSSHDNNVVFSNDLNNDESHSTVVIVVAILIAFLAIISISIFIIAYWKRHHIGSYFLNINKKASDDTVVNGETVSNLSITIAQPASDYLVNSERGAGTDQCDVPVQQTNAVVAQQETVNGLGHGTAVNGISINYAYMPSSLPMTSENSTDPCEDQLEYADTQSVSPIQSTDDNLSMPKLTSLRSDPDGKR